jgi:DNA repair protein RadA/Sms
LLLLPSKEQQNYLSLERIYLRRNAMFICSKCGYETLAWDKECQGCFSEGTLTKQLLIEKTETKRSFCGNGIIYPTGFDAFDKLIGGGIRPGQIYFMYAEPGTGKTTLLLQIAAYILKEGA